MESCGRTFCPILAKSRALSQVKPRILKEDFAGTSPAPFVGHNFYPNVYMGILSPPEPKQDAWLYDSPKYWAKKDFGIPTIVEYRSALINSRFRTNVRQISKLADIGQEIGLSSRPIDLEISLKDKPHFTLKTDAYHAPMGPNAVLRKAKVTENPKIHTKVQKVVDDTDLKANQALNYLFRHGFSENFLTKALSVGAFGVRSKRKLVPTRWSITATDDALGKQLIESIKRYKESDYLAYFGGYLGNYFLVLLFPEIWSFELFETYAPKAEWNISNEYRFMTDYEPYEGRKRYAENCGGGYYAARLPVLEKLNSMKRQACALVLRFITGEYAVPLGVWVVREAVRRTLNTRPLSFASKELMIKYVNIVVKKKFSYNAENLLKESVLLKKLRSQQKLLKFI